MLRTTTLTLVAVPFAASLLAGCGITAERNPANHTDPVSAPDGVVRQYKVLAEELKEKGQSAESGGWTVNLITEAAEPWHVVEADGSSSFREPAVGETNHIEIIPVEKATGRIVPDVPVSVDVVDKNGASVQKLDLTFYWSTFAHYANNFSVPEAGHYSLRVTVGVPTFPRHGNKDDAPALSTGARVEFKHVELGAE